MFTQEKYIMLFRYIILVGAITGTLFKIPVSSYAAFILISLVIIINSQVRIVYLRNKAAAFSIILEVAFVLYISFQYGGFVYLVLFASMADSCMMFKEESYTLSLFTGIGLTYLLYKFNPIEWVVIVLAFYIMAFLLFQQLRKEFEIRQDTEILYDKIRRYTYELEAARSRLLDYSKQVEKVAQLEERNRISRELHDSIGHSLTGILMQVDACIQVMQVNKEKGLEILQSVYDNINKSIEVVRQTVRELRPSDYRTNLGALTELIDKFKENTGVNVELNISGTPYKMLPSIETVLYRNAQEALTNAVRHGHARNITAHLLFKTDTIEFTISNDGESAGEINKGFGLSGMEERIGLIGGTVSFCGKNGFTVYMSIPRGEV